ncbi:glycoprotein 3-alpha-L-fucosyltransferase A, partial [Aplysia californica]|uniref:Glycoprotein 3-alpha-L-fucosyltransferase A n=1 Tax=Aplysia californica TaxID=6500 RepID=A0ABM1A3V0_APLCA
MRFRLKKTLQISAVCACVLLYINFFLVSKSTFSIDLGLGGRREAGGGRSLDHKGPRYQPITLDFRMNNGSWSNMSKQVVGQPRATTEEVRIQKLNPRVIYPSAEHYVEDRILEQLQFTPMSLQRSKITGQEVKLKKILLYTGIGSWGIKKGQTTFLEQKCVVNECDVTDNRKDLEVADVVMFHSMPHTGVPKPPHQSWLLYLLESPYHTPSFSSDTGVFNWTATYRHDSTIVAPYEKFVYYNASVRTLP